VPGGLATVKAQKALRGGESACDVFDLVSRVAQIFNLLYRRFVVGRHPNEFARPLEIVRSAGCKPAIRQIKNLRYAFQRRIDVENSEVRPSAGVLAGEFVEVA